MLFNHRIAMLLASGFLGTFVIVRAQIMESDIPMEIRYILHQDLDVWEPPEEIRKNFPYYLSGFDEENRPVWVMEFGKWDVRGALEKGKDWESALDKHIDQWLYRMFNSSGLRATPEEPVNEIIDIHDMDGYNIRQINSPRALAFIIRKMRTVSIAMRFAHSAYAINTNFIAENLLNILKPVLGKDFQKLIVYGTNKNKWLPVLLKSIPKDQLPERYGGSKKFTPVEIFGK
ncbi:unnamed protein product [Allacma fusca]|uniref:CRAL-TRIO domain-containing protein n=1 Tax=Allacma fusca TaxID=39272 RepID=A0A8J2NQQ3_9HEXA|nr:unnamed protein product [Allacma fusca]